MGDVVKFPGNSDERREVERLISFLEEAGICINILRTENNWKGELAFSMLGSICRNSSDVIVAMCELNVLFNSDEALRLDMYEEYFSMGGLFYEASTSSAVAFHEMEPVRR